MLLHHSLRTLVARLQASHGPPTRRKLGGLVAAAVATVAASLTGEDAAARRRRSTRRDAGGRRAAADRIGAAGKKKCGKGKKKCGSKCVNLKKDANHCGKCNNACPGSIRCAAGTCTPRLVRAWGAPGAANGNFTEPCGISLTPDGVVLVSDTKNGRLQLFTGEGSFLSRWGTKGTNPTTELNLPLGVAVTTQLPAGMSATSGWAVYLADYGNHRVKLVDWDNEVWLRQYGDTSGSDPGWFSSPSYVAVGPSGRFYVTDTGNQRVQSWSKDGLGTGQDLIIFNGADAPDGPFTHPIGIAIGPDGDVYVTDGNLAKPRIMAFTADGDFKRQWGSKGTAPGQLNTPIGIAVSADNRVFIADRGDSRVKVFSVTGTFLFEWGDDNPDTAGPINPRAIAINDNGIYVVDDVRGRVFQFQ